MNSNKRLKRSEDEGFPINGRKVTLTKPLENDNPETFVEEIYNGIKRKVVKNSKISSEHKFKIQIYSKLIGSIFEDNLRIKHPNSTDNVLNGSGSDRYVPIKLFNVF